MSFSFFLSKSTPSIDMKYSESLETLICRRLSQREKTPPPIERKEEGRVTLTRFVQLEKALFPIEIRDKGRSMPSILQPLKAPSSILLRFLGSLISDKSEQSKKVSFSIVYRLSWREMELILHSLNALSPILDTLLGTIIRLKYLLVLKHPFPIEVTPSGIINSLSFLPGG